MNDEFYIGWEKQAPPTFSRRTKAAVALIVLLASGGSLLLAFNQRLIGDAVFEWNREREFAGVFRAKPAPHLVTEADDGSTTTHLLVAPWKFGLDRDAAREFDGRQVSLAGRVIRRRDQSMIEVQPQSLSAIGPNTGAPATAASATSAGAGRRTLRGEIVDSKCWLGVMNPGRLATHRGCAVRCLSGGVPPILLVQYEGGRTEHYLLVGSDGRALNREILDFVAEPVTITGEVARQGDLLVLRAEPGDIARLERKH
ncbi:MAG TPA: hypothetical protein DCY13_14530 [Verrucomicrobiales bacterium]|nr:hypothetical protein [Verrucomicrobiales bacterium]